MKIELLNINNILVQHGNVRKEVDSKGIEALALSIAAVGLINPISVHKVKNHYEIVAGQRRLLAYKHLEKEFIEAVVFDKKEAVLFGMQVQENIQREKVSCVDEGRAFAVAIRKLSITQKGLAELIAKSESYVADRIATNKYFPELLRALKKGKISFSVAREFAKIKSKTDLKRYLEFAENSGCNPRLARNWVRQYKLNNLAVDQFDLDSASDADASVESNNKLVTGCHVCKLTFDLSSIRHLNLCPSCFNIIMNS